MESCVVVVDDEREMRELLCDVLEDDGMEVVPVARPESVEEATPRCKPDLVLWERQIRLSPFSNQFS
jgi:DNA-binding response OmpR family regulator